MSAPSGEIYRIICDFAHLGWTVVMISIGNRRSSWHVGPHHGDARRQKRRDLQPGGTDAQSLVHLFNLNRGQGVRPAAEEPVVAVNDKNGGWFGSEQRRLLIQEYGIFIAFLILAAVLSVSNESS